MKKPVDAIIRELRKTYRNNNFPAVKGNPAMFRLLIQTILAARNTDENATVASKKLFAEYKTPQQISKAPLPVLEKLVKQGVFYRAKSRNIKKLCQILVKSYKGKVPNTMAELIKLPGVGRKTANIVLTYGFRTPEGIAVDTHVFRTVNRIGIVQEKTPEKTEKALLHIVPKKFWMEFNRLFVEHGRNVCRARKPNCEKCRIRKWCDYQRK